MLKLILTHKLRFLIGIILVCLFALIRINEKKLFYDPFLYYFEGDFNEMPLPKFDGFLLMLNLFLRYTLNMTTSLGLIYVIFKDINTIKFVSILYIFSFLFLMIAFFAFIAIYSSHNNFMLFYIRRFLIQPIFILLFIPALFYQMKIK